MRETIRIDQTELVFLASGEETAGQVTMIELSVAPQARVPVAPALALIVMTPALIGPPFFREVAELVKAGLPDPRRVGEVMLRHGLVPAP